VARVFSHLGSGAEIGLATLRAALGEGPEPDREAIWARWNGLSPEQMVGGFVGHDDRYLTAVEQLDPGRRTALRVPMFLGPADLATVLMLRLAEHALHSWDIRVSADPHATLLPAAVPLLLDLPPLLAPGWPGRRWRARRPRCAWRYGPPTPSGTTC
jgi:Mycothiol maleylpyruvate isomerase N-terminal domain